MLKSPEKIRYKTNKFWKETLKSYRGEGEKSLYQKQPIPNNDITKDVKRETQTINGSSE